MGGSIQPHDSASAPDADATLGGYLTVHQRAPAFEGPDGAAYSAALYVDETPHADGRFGGAILFVRWNAGGDAPSGHVESDYLAWGDTTAQVDAALRQLTLHELKRALDRAVAVSRDAGSW